MAIIPIIGNVTVSGSSKEISGGYANIDGIWKELVKTYVNIDGIWKDAWKTAYKWEKYSVNTVTTYLPSFNGTMGTMSERSTVNCASNFSFNTETGVGSLYNPTSVAWDDYVEGIYRTNRYIRVNSTTPIAQVKSVTSTKITYAGLKVIETQSSNQGDFIEYVTSDDETAYPENGIHTDGYWYVKMVDTPATKTFTISGDIDTITCEFEEGMTWEDWVNSDYAIDYEEWNAGERGVGYDGYFWTDESGELGYNIPNTSAPYYLFDNDGNFMYPDSLITEGYNYKAYTE